MALTRASNVNIITSRLLTETVNKACNIVRKQLALRDGSDVTGESELDSLEANCLNMVSKWYIKGLFEMDTRTG